MLGLNMSTTFTKLNDGWNAEPNGQEPQVSVGAGELLFTFLLNGLRYPECEAAEKGILRFPGCWRYRVGGPNEEGWYRGQCRFSRLAPAWGEFYEVQGDLLLDFVPDPAAFRSRGVQLEPRPLRWVTVGEPEPTSRHFLFYLRDQTFECDAADWSFTVLWKAQQDAAPNSRPPSQLPVSPEVQSSDTQRTPSSGGCG
jgi:hypothetical protein